MRLKLKKKIYRMIKQIQKLIKKKKIYNDNNKLELFSGDYVLDFEIQELSD